jgi:hypothetical protein
LLLPVLLTVVSLWRVGYILGLKHTLFLQKF